MKEEKIRKAVRQRYGKIAKTKSTDCGCGCTTATPGKSISEQIGYSKSDLSSVPEGADLNLGCGNPVGLCIPQRRRNSHRLGLRRRIRLLPRQEKKLAQQAKLSA